MTRLKQQMLTPALLSTVLLIIPVILCLFVDQTWAADNNLSKPSKTEPDTSGSFDKAKVGESHLQKKGKTRDHLNKPYIEHMNSLSVLGTKEIVIQKTLQQLLQIYKSSIKPLEDAYNFVNLNKGALLETEIVAKPLVLFVGPWSTGKTTFINYLLDIEDREEKLHTGAEPTTTDFVVIQNGSRYRTMTGMQLVSDQSKAFASLEKYGQGFIQKLQGIEMKSDLLDLITFVDTPGIIENKRQQERGYPFSEVFQWFLQRASLIFLVFDPSKLEVGSELESVFSQLKGYEAKLKILLNKADTITQQELMKVYGALFWNLAPLVNSVEPPRVYVGSFWSKSKNQHSLATLFLEEEQTLMLDLHRVVENWVEDKIAYVRRHACMVRLHALTVDSFIQAFYKHKGFFTDNDVLLNDIINRPEKYNIFQDVLKQTDISKYDLPEAKTYIEFFSIHKFYSFRPLDYYCPHLFMLLR
uniref:Dynamin-type G domain-containing protein n=2 Tax=Arion vulgaris TaxID=1028688 RepID=A0A0B7A239_9EUPU